MQKPQYDLPNPKKGNVETLILTDSELTSANVQLYFKRSREAKRGDLSFYRSEIIDILIDNMLNLRFQDELSKPETPYISAWAGDARYATSSRFYVMGATAKSGAAEASLTELLRAKETMLRYGFTDSEMAIAAESLLSDVRQMVQEKDRQESDWYVDGLVSYYLGGGNFADLEWELDAIQQMLPHIKARDINAAIKNYFVSDDLQVFIFAPDAEKANLPSDERIRQMVKNSGKLTISRPEFGAVEEGLLSAIPVRGSIVKESIDEETRASIWELDNGARVILKPTNNKNDEIVLQATARGGTSSAAVDDYISANLAAEMIQVSGLGPWSRSELTRKLAGKQVTFSYSVSHYYRNFRGTATSGDLKTLFEMLYLSFTNPRIDPVAVQAMMEQYASSLALRNENPRTAFTDEINRTLYGGNLHFKPLELDDLPKADIDTALAFIRKGLNPADYTFVFTGNLEPEIMADYIETYLASIPQKESWNAWTDLAIVRPEELEKNVYKGKEEQSLVYITWFTKSPFTEELNAITQVLGEYLEIRMTDEIREKLGGVYSISVGVSIAPVPQGELSMWVYFACDPKRVRELSAAVIDLLEKTAGKATSGSATSGNIATEGSVINQDTFEKAVEALIKEWETSMQSNSYIAQSYANSSVLLDLPLSRLNRRSQYFRAVTEAEIQAICAQLMQGKGPAQIMLFPEQ
jgi:zinc protease